MKPLFNQARIFVMMAIAIMAFNSCKKYLQENPKTSFGTDYVFNDVADAYKAVLGAYSQLSGDQGYGIRLSMYYTVDDDEILGPTGNGDNDRRDIARYSVNANNAQLAAPFNQIFAGIERANICIANIPAMGLYKTGNSQQKGELQRLYGEALTLRAQFYFEGVRNWGDLPAQWVPSAQLTNLFLPRTNRDTIYNHILNDLLTAEGLVPWRTEVSSLGDPLDERITKGSIKALRARIALFRGGYSLRNDTKQMQRPADYLNYYQVALQECTEIMARSDQHSLDPSFRDLFKNNICNTTKSQDPYGEVVYQAAMSGGNSANGDSKLGYYDGPRVNGIRGNGLFIVPTYFYSFSQLDTRRDVTVAPYNVNADGVTKTGISIAAMADGKFRSDWVSPALSPTNTVQYFGTNWVFIRFSDVLLMFAEADNEIHAVTGPSQAAINAFETVRKRAFGANAALIGTTPTDHDGFFQALVKERGWEFGDEGIRKYDLIRWNLLGQTIANTKTSLLALSAFQPPYNNLAVSMYYIKTATGDDSSIWANSYYAPSPTTAPAGTTKVTFLTPAQLDPTTGNVSFMGRYALFFTPNKSELLPLPQTSMDNNFNLRPQNPGY